MLSSSNYIPKGIVSNDLYQKIVEAIDYVIANNETDFLDILNKYKDFTNQQGQGCKETLKEFGFENIIRILDIPDSTAARLAYFVNAISMLKGHKEGLILVTRLLGGFAFVTEWFDGWTGYSSTTYTSLTPYILDDTVINVSSLDGVEYLYKCIGAGNTGAIAPVWPIYLGETVIDGTVTWVNFGKPQKLKYWEPNTTYVEKQHVISSMYQRYMVPPPPSGFSQSINPPNPPYAIDHNTQGRQYVFECDVAGTSGAVEPSPWDTTIGNITADNTVQWKCLDPEAYFYFNIVWTFPPGLTTPHTFDYFRAFCRSYVYPVLATWIIAPAGSFQFSRFPSWGTGRSILNGSFMYPSTGNYPTTPFVYEVTGFVSSPTGAVEPAWPVVLGASVVDDVGNTWTCRSHVDQLGLGFSGHYIGWTPGAAPGLGDIYVPTVYNGFAYQCTVPGVTDVVEPIWPMVLGALVVDNTTTWVCIPVGGRLAYIYV